MRLAFDTSYQILGLLTAPSIEADLDMEYTMGVATGVPVTFLTSENFDLTSAMIDTAAVIGNYSKPPSVVTTSYAGDEDGFSESLAMYVIVLSAAAM